MIYKSVINIFLTLTLFGLMLIAACDDTINISDIDNKIIPSSNVSYSQHIQPVLTAKCARAGCHDDQTREAGLSLTSYSNTTQSYLVVAPLLPQNSKLVWSIEGTSGNLMPPLGYPPVTKNQIDGIKTWIKEGAKNN
ncbi:MAG: c-type cytochrome domain-containing protein [Melioribacteraceae bacterium]